MLATFVKFPEVKLPGAVGIVTVSTSLLVLLYINGTYNRLYAVPPVVGYVRTFGPPVNTSLLDVAQLASEKAPVAVIVIDVALAKAIVKAALELTLGPGEFVPTLFIGSPPVLVENMVALAASYLAL